MRGGVLGVVLAALAVLAVVGGAALARRAASPQPTSAVAIGGPFQMVDQDGRPVDQRVLDGRWSAVFFGYVSCPDTCPATLQTLAAAQARLGADAQRFQTVFVTVDPDRDGPKQLKVYLDQADFPKGAVGLTGTPAQVAQITRVYRAYYAKAPRKDGGYDMDHTAVIYLMDPKGRFVAPLQETAGANGLADQIRAAMRAG